MSYEVSTPVFEGPLDLLLHLIAKEQVNLFEISLSKIVERFLESIKAIVSLDLEVATEFLLIASTLVELKLRKLLPDPIDIEMQEELALLEERDMLLAKLLEYSTFKQAAIRFFDMAHSQSRSYPRTMVTEPQFLVLAPDPLENTTPQQLANAFLKVAARNFLEAQPPTVDLHHVTAPRVSLAQAINEFAQILPGQGQISFRSLVSTLSFSDESGAQIVSLLAVLELYKQGWLQLAQETNFGEILLDWQNSDTGLDQVLVTTSSQGGDE